MKAFLAFVAALFIAILVVVYYGAKKANPVILDQSGKPLPTTAQSK